MPPMRFSLPSSESCCRSPTVSFGQFWKVSFATGISGALCAWYEPRAVQANYLFSLPQANVIKHQTDLKILLLFMLVTNWRRSK